jgi:hypothetical protein
VDNLCVTPLPHRKYTALQSPVFSVPALHQHMLIPASVDIPSGVQALRSIPTSIFLAGFSYSLRHLSAVYIFISSPHRTTGIDTGLIPYGFNIRLVYVLEIIG